MSTWFVKNYKVLYISGKPKLFLINTFKGKLSTILKKGNKDEIPGTEAFFSYPNSYFHSEKRPTLPDILVHWLYVSGILYSIFSICFMPHLR